MPSSRGTHETHSIAATSVKTAVFHFSGVVHMFTRWSIHRK